MQDNSVCPIWIYNDNSLLNTSVFVDCWGYIMQCKVCTNIVLKTNSWITLSSRRVEGLVLALTYTEVICDIHMLFVLTLYTSTCCTCILRELLYLCGLHREMNSKSLHLPSALDENLYTNGFSCENYKLLQATCCKNNGRMMTIRIRLG